MKEIIVNVVAIIALIILWLDAKHVWGVEIRNSILKIVIGAIMIIFGFTSFILDFKNFIK